MRYWLICSMAASSSVCMLRRLCSRASKCCRSWPSSARSSSGVRPAKPAGGTGIGGKAKVEAEAYPSKEEGKGSQGQDQPLGQVQSQMLGQKYSCQQLWWWLLHWVEKWLHWWTEELQPLLSLGEVGQVERDPLVATVGTCPEEKEAGGPGGN